MIFSKVVCGHWRLKEWLMSPQQLYAHTEKLIQLNITSFDHADIYGDYECESLFGKALELNKSLRKNIQIITKCGIQLISKKHAHRLTKHYDYSYEHIVESVNNSLLNFKTDYIDLLLLHRPSPFLKFEDISKAFDILKQSGKVLHFGVSNFSPLQFELLQKHLGTPIPLITNQIEISPYCLDHFENNNLLFLQANNIVPMAWSPLAGGKLFNPEDDKSIRIKQTLNHIALKNNIPYIESVVYAWLFNHPAKIVPIFGSQHIERAKIALDAQNITLSTEEWFQIYAASKGHPVP